MRQPDVAAALSAGRDATLTINYFGQHRESDLVTSHGQTLHSVRDFVAASADLLSWPQDIEGHVMERPELAVIEERLRSVPEADAANQSLLLFGEPGSGKSALLAALGDRLTAAGATVLGIKADVLPPDVTGVSDLGQALGLGGDLVQELRSQAARAPLYILIDQLDAVASLIDGSGERLRALSHLVRRLRLDPGVRIVVSARPFEFNADGAFRAAFPPTAVQIVQLSLPSQSAVDEMLRRIGIDPAEIPEGLREIVRIPQAMRDIVAARREGFAWSAMTSWRRTQSVRFDRLVEQNPRLNLDRLAEHLIGALRQTGALWTAEASLPLGSRRAVERLVSESILRRREGAGLVGFAHQTWAETLDGRLALAQGNLATRVCTAGHNLLARPQALSMLRYVRDDAQNEYDAAIAKLWDDPTLRRHLQHLILDLAAGNTEPTPDEQRLVSFVVIGDDAALAQRALRMSAGKPAWFPVLRGAVSDRMASTDADRVWSVVHWLAAASAFATVEVTTLLKRHWLGKADRERFIAFVLDGSGSWDEQTFNLFETVISNLTRFAFIHIAVVRRQAESGNHTAAARLLGIIWDRLVVLARAAAEDGRRDDEGPPPADENGLVEAMRRLQQAKRRSFAHHFSRVLGEVSGLHDFAKFVKQSAGAYVAALVPRLAALVEPIDADEETVRATAIDFWDLCRLGRKGGASQAHFDVPLIEAIGVALEEYAHTDPKNFINAVKASGGKNHLLDRLFALAFAVSASTLTDAGLAFIEASPGRLELGDRYGDDQSDTLRLLSALVPFLTAVDSDRLIGFIKGWSFHHVDGDDTVEQRKYYRRENRRLRTRLLMALAPAQLSHAATRFIQEEIRAFPDASRSPRRHMSGYVRSPMSAEAMARASDKHILRLFAELPDTTHGDHPSGRRFLTGGSRQASSAFAEFAKKQPERALGLLDRFSAETHQRPVGDALRALAEMENSDPARVLAALDSAIVRGFGNDDFIRDATMVLDNLAFRLGGLDDRWVERLISWIAPPKNALGDPEINTTLDTASAERELPTSVLFRYGGLHVVSASNNYMIMRAITHALLCREHPAYSRWIDFLEWRLSQSEDDAVWYNFSPNMIYIANVEPSRANHLVADLFRHRPAIRDSDEGAVLVARLLQVLSRETVDPIISAWRASDWPLASIAIGEVSALRAALFGPAFSIDDWLAPSDSVELHPDILAGIANLAVEYWNDDDAGRRDWARKALAPLAARSEPRIAKVCASIFHRIAPWPQEADVHELLRVLSNNLVALQHVSETAVDDRLGELVDNANFHEVILDLIKGLIKANGSSLNDQSTAGPLLARGLIPIVLTIHRDRVNREMALGVFEELLDVVPDPAEELLSGLV